MNLDTNTLVRDCEPLLTESNMCMHSYQLHNMLHR